MSCRGPVRRRPGSIATVGACAEAFYESLLEVTIAVTMLYYAGGSRAAAKLGKGGITVCHVAVGVIARPGIAAFPGSACPPSRALG